MKRFVVPVLLFPLLASCGSAAPETRLAPQQTQTPLGGQWSAAVGGGPTLRLSLEQSGTQVRGQAELPALAWNDAGTFEVQGWQDGLRATALLLRGGEKVYDLSCERSDAGRWHCDLETQSGSAHLSSARAWRLTLAP